MLGAEGRAGREAKGREGTAGAAGIPVARERDGSCTEGRAKKLPWPGETQPGPELRPERGGRSKWRRRGGARGEEGRAASLLRASPWPGSSPAAAGKQGARGEDAGRSEQLFSLAGARRRRGGLGRWPRARETIFFSSLSFSFWFKRLSLLPREAAMCGREDAGWSGGSPPGARPRRNRAGSFPEESSPGDWRACPARFLRAGCRGLSTPPCPAIFPPGQNGETEADGPCLEDQRSVNFCPLAFVHAGVLKALKLWVLFLV